MSIYNSVVKQGKSDSAKSHTELTGPVTKLNEIRDEQAAKQVALDHAASSSSSQPAANTSQVQPNRVDTIISDVFALLSLFFLTIGKSRETPAAYCQIMAMRVSFRVRTPERC